MKKTCKHCGKEYNYTHHNDGTYKYHCCIECKEADKKLEEELKNAPKKLICQHCGKEYIWENKGNWDKNNNQCFIKGRNHSNEMVNSKKFCCFECGKAYTRKKVRDTNLRLYGNEVSMKTDIMKKRLRESLAKIPEEKKKLIDEKRKETCLKKYGVEYVTQDEEFKKRIKQSYKMTYEQRGDEIKRRMEQRCLEKYGVTSTNKLESTKQKAKETCLRKYGVEFAIQNEDMKKRIEETNLKKYGTKVPSCNKDVAHKISLALSKKSEEEKNLIKEKIRQTNLQRYGVEYFCLTDKARNSLSCISKPNRRFQNMLKNVNIDSELEFSLVKYAYDLKLKDNTLIEIDPTVTHNSSREINIGNYFVKPKSPTYHQEKSQHALKNGYFCLHIWDWDDEDKIIEMLKPKSPIYARTLKIKEPSYEETGTFLDQYHLQGSCNSQEVRLGLYRDDELIQIMTFGKPRYNKKYQWELLRLCTKFGYSVVGGAEKLFKHFITTYNPDSIISYCDNSKFKGDVYKRIGMNFKSYGHPSKHWFNLFTFRHITDNLLRQRGYSQLHNDKIHKKGECNEILMLEAGYLEIYDCGQSIYTWNKE